jgi:hypothetical protein
MVMPFDASWTTGEHGPGEDEYTIKMFEVSDEAWQLNETTGDDSMCRESLKRDAAVEVVVGAARVDLFPTFTFGDGGSSRRVQKKKRNENVGETKTNNSNNNNSSTNQGTSSSPLSLAKKGDLRARAASVRVTLLLRLIIDAVRKAAVAAETQSKLEAASLARVVRARSDSARSDTEAKVSDSSISGKPKSTSPPANFSSASNIINSPTLSSSSSSSPHHVRDGSTSSNVGGSNSNLGPRRRSSRRASSGGSLITDTAILEALNVADVLLPYIEDTERELHFQLNGLIVKLNDNGNIEITNVVKVTENGVTVQREGDSKSSCLTFRMRVTAGEFIHDIMTLAMDGVS